jgi:hypothetical protein
MPLDHSILIDQIDTVLDQCLRLTANPKYHDLSDLPKADVSQAVHLLLAAIQRLAPPGTSYVKNSEAVHKGHGSLGLEVAPLIGILRAIRADYSSGHLKSFAELVHADIFADFLEMADYLLQQGYKDAAAVIVGSVLEEHIRKLCQKHDVAILQSGGGPKKADSLNSELAGATVYSKLDQKSVTAWLDLRNKSAHGKYGEYANEQVSVALLGVRDFISRHSA